ncbi:MAG: limB2 [Modestobacter sp.]|nr:limB2 [Modestobacter sp.]
MIDFINEACVGAIGTFEEARAQVQRLWDQSGGFGAMLLLAHEWANPQATRRSYELIAQHVMPHFQGGAVTHAQASLTAKELAMGKREDYAAQQMQAVATMTERYQQEVAAKG